MLPIAGELAAEMTVFGVAVPEESVPCPAARLAASLGPGTSTRALCLREREMVRATETSAVGLTWTTAAIPGESILALLFALFCIRWAKSELLG
jgi:hypothetical protein